MPLPSLADPALPSLTVALAMQGDGRVPVLPPPVPGVWHDLHVQRLPAPLPPALAALASRADVRVLGCPGTGAARSRNAALDTARGDLLLFADDDMIQDPAGHRRLRQDFAGNPATDILCARLIGPDGRPHKGYGPDGQALRFWNAARVGTPEIALRLDRVRRAGARFDEGFGAGTAVPLGDEYIFLMDCRRARLTGRHVDVTVGVHPPHSSGLAFGRETLPWRRAVFRRALGWYWRPAHALFLLRNRHRLAGGG